MTITLDKKQIHIGWPAAISILAVGVPFIWGCAVASTKLYQMQTRIYNTVVRLDKNDSLRSSQITKIENKQGMQSHQIDSLSKIIKPQLTTFNQAARSEFYIQQWVNGRLVLKKAYPNRL